MRTAVLLVATLLCSCGRVDIERRDDAGPRDAGRVDAGADAGADGGELPIDAGPPDPSIIWRGEDPTHLALDPANGRIFWTAPTAGTVRRANGDGTAPTLIASAQSRPTFIAIDSTAVYWANDAEIMSSPIDASAPTSFVAVAEPSGLLADGNYVFFGSGSGGTIRRFVVGGAFEDFVMLPAGHRMGAFGMGMGNVYYLDDTTGDLLQTNKQTLQQWTLATGVSATAITANFDIVYWTSSAGDDVSMAPNNARGAAAILSSGELGAAGIAWDATHIYWTDSESGRVMRAEQTTGANIEQIATARRPWGIAVDTQYVYYADPGSGTDGTIHRIPVPP